MKRYHWIILQDHCRSNQKEIADSEATLGLCWSAFSCNASAWCNKIYLETRGTLIAQHLWIFMLKSVKVTKHLVALCWQFVISENQIHPVFKSSMTFRSAPQRVKSQISCFSVNADSDKLPTPPTSLTSRPHRYQITGKMNAGHTARRGDVLGVCLHVCV